MKTLGISKMGMNGSKYYEWLINKVIKPKEEFRVEQINFKNKYDFILFDGGHDVTPEYYGEKKSIYTYNLELRDEYEQNIFLKYLPSETKFVGICRGSQFLNVMFGGTLYQDLIELGLGHQNFHVIEVADLDDKYTMRHILPKYTLVNSTHHQAVKNLGKDLVINSWEEITKVVESYTHTDDKVRATQYHPEFYNDFAHTIPVLKWLFRDC